MAGQTADGAEGHQQKAGKRMCKRGIYRKVHRFHRFSVQSRYGALEGDDSALFGKAGKGKSIVGGKAAWYGVDSNCAQLPEDIGIFSADNGHRVFA